MAEFIDTLNAPGDYQRPVGTVGKTPDIFGAAADLWNKATNTGRSGSSGPSLTEQRNLMEDVGQDVLARGVAQLQTGRQSGDEDILAMFGADAQSAFAEMKRLDNAFQEGEMTPAVREVMLERLVTGVMGAYPEASAEIMGEALDKLGVSHAFGRAYRMNREQQLAAEKDVIARDSHYYDLAVKGGFGYDLATGTERDRGSMVAQGMIIAHTATLDADIKKNAEAAAALRAADAAGNKALAAQLKTHAATTSFELGNKAIQIGSLGVGQYVADLTSLLPTVGDDPTKNEAYIQLVQKGKADLASAREMINIKLTEGRATKEDFDRVQTWFKTQEDGLDSLLNGGAANAVALPKMWDMIIKSGAVEASQAVPTYTRAVAMFGQGFVSDLINLRIPGVGPQQTQVLRDEILSGLSTGLMTTEAAKERVNQLQSALKGTNIPQIVDPAKRQEALTMSATGLAQVLPKLGGRVVAPSEQDLSNFNGSSLSLMSAASADAPTISLDNVKKLTPLLFSPNWRAAMVQFEQKGDATVAENMKQYNTIVTAKVFDTTRANFVNRDLVAFDSATQRFVAKPKTVFSVGSGSAGSQAGGRDSSQAAANQTSKDAAGELNKMLDHLEFMSKMTPIVPKEALEGKPGPDGKTQKLSVREVFATDANLTKSIQNYVDNLPTDKMPTSDDKFWETHDAYADLDVRSKLDLTSMNNIMTNARLTAATIRMKGQEYSRATDVPVTDLQSYMAKNNARELGGERSDRAHYAPGEGSSARGSYGFLKGTWVQNLDSMVSKGMKIEGYEKMSVDQKFDLMKDQVLEDKVMEEFTLNNISALRTALGRNVSWEEVDIAHVFGAGGAADFLAVLETAPNTPASKVLSSAVIEANKGGLTKGNATVLDVWNRRTGRDDGRFQEYMESAGYVGSYSAPVLSYMADIDDFEIEGQQ